VKKLMKKYKAAGKFMGKDTRGEDKEEGGWTLVGGILGEEKGETKGGGRKQNFGEKEGCKISLWVSTSGLVLLGFLAWGPGNMIS
jgi:hypothetical protein